MSINQYEKFGENNIKMDEDESDDKRILNFLLNYRQMKNLKTCYLHH